MEITINSDSFLNALKALNALRRENKNHWLFIRVNVGNEETVFIKSFNTSIQILRKDGINFPSTFDASVKDWQASIMQALTYVIPARQFN